MQRGWNGNGNGAEDRIVREPKRHRRTQTTTTTVRETSVYEWCSPPVCVPAISLFTFLLANDRFFPFVFLLFFVAAGGATPTPLPAALNERRQMNVKQRKVQTRTNNNKQ